MSREVHEIAATIDRASVKSEDVERNVIRCPDEKAAKAMIELIEKTRS